MFLGTLSSLEEALAAVTGNRKTLQNQVLSGMVQRLLPLEATLLCYFSLLTYFPMRKDYFYRDIAECRKRWYTRHLFQQKITKRVHLSLFRPFLLVIPNCFLHQSFLDMLPSLLRRGKRGMSGGHSEMLTTVKIHEVQNGIVSLLSFVGKIKESSDCTNFLKILGLEHTLPAHQVLEISLNPSTTLLEWLPAATKCIC